MRVSAPATGCAAVALPAFATAFRADPGTANRDRDLPALNWLASRGHRVSVSGGEWRAWLLSRFGPGGEVLQHCPAGAALRTLVTGRRAEGCWACAEPVHLVAALDHLRLAPRSALRVAPAEGRALVESLSEAIAGSGFTLQHLEHGPWLLACRDDIDCETIEPALAEGRDVRDCLPAGRDGAAVRRLTSELQILLHDHPVNLRRSDVGLPPVNSIWLWGFGRAVHVTRPPLPMLCCDDFWLAGLWQVHGLAPQPLGAARDALAAGASTLVAAADASDDPGAQLALWESLLGVPLARALKSGRIRNASLLLGDTSYVLSGAARFAFWRQARSWTDLLG